MLAADKIAAHVADLEEEEEHHMVAKVLPASTMDCAMPLEHMCLIADRKEPQIKCEQHGTR